MLSNQITLDKIFLDSKKTIHFISKLFKIIIYFLEKYLFLDTKDYSETEDDMILKTIFIYNRITNNEGDFDVDLQNICLKSIFEF